jgi:hypothetical protein
MGIDSTFRRLGRFLDDWDRGETTVHTVTVTDCADAGTDEGVAVEVEVSVPLATPEDHPEGAVCTPEIGPDGTLTLNLETDVPIAASSDETVDIEPVDASFGSDGTVTVTCSGTVAVGDAGETRTASRGRSLKTESTDGGVDDDRPPFKNPELLREVYDAHDTFAEMAEALDMDVTGETVRRYMIDYNIHQPDSYSSNGATAADGDGGEAVVLSDGIGLPDNVSVEALIETVNRSNTIHEVKEDLDMERKEAHEMLKELNLVSVVMGRLANDAGREMQREDIVEHLREVSQQR